MRDLILFAVLASIIPLILRQPFVGVLAWIWISLMHPQRQVYGFLSGFELNFMVAALTGVAWLASKEQKQIPRNGVIAVLFLFVSWASVSTFFALERSHSLPIWDRTIKTFILALAVAMLTTTRTRLQAVIWTVVVALGFYAVKGGGFTLLTGGQQRVFGPDNSQISDNNAFGLAMIVMVPLLNYLRVTSRAPLVKWSCLAVLGLTLLAILGTYSRGALVALGAAAAAFVVRSRSGLVVILAGAVLLVSAPSLLPQGWFDRMSTVQTYQADSSFEGRVAAWRTSLNIAKARPLVGGGFRAVEIDRVAQAYQSPGSLSWGRAAHSIYFEVLGDTGIVGLALYLVMLACAWLNTSTVLAVTARRPDLKWANELARMLQVSMVGLMVGGAALSMAYYDGFLVMLVLTACLLQVVRQSAPLQDPGPRWRRDAAHLSSQTKRPEHTA